MFSSPQDYLSHVTRRHFLSRCAMGLGGIALASLLNRHAVAAGPALANPLAPKPTHFARAAKNIIYLFMAGARASWSCSTTSRSSSN